MINFPMTSRMLLLISNSRFSHIGLPPFRQQHLNQPFLFVQIPMFRKNRYQTFPLAESGALLPVRKGL